MGREDLHREVKVLVHDTATKRARVLSEASGWAAKTYTDRLKY